MKKILILILISSVVFAQEIETETFLNGNNVTGISSQGKYLWISTNGNGIYKFDPVTGTQTNYSTQNRKIQQDFFFCIESNDKYVWAGSADGLFMLDLRRGRWSKRKFAKGGQLSNWVRSLKFDPKENVLWIGRFMYLTKYDIKKRRFFDYDMTQQKNIKTNTIKTIELDGDSLVWFGTEAGLHKYDKSLDIENSASVSFYDNKLNFFEGMADQVSIASLLIAENRLWIGLDEFITPENPDFNLGGLYDFDRRNEWIRYDTRNGLNGNGVLSLERTGNLIWLSQYQFGRSTKEQYGRGVAVINLITSEVKQISDDNIPSFVNDMYFDGKNIWFAADNGLVKLVLSNDFAKWE